jgi:tRNA (guanine37-N1)-methyltransferase
MKFTILTLFPTMIEPFLNESIIGRAQQDDKLEIDVRQLRDWATDKHHTVDDTTYGGGAGMVLKVDVIDKALTELKGPNSRVILLTPQGQRFTQTIARDFAKSEHDLILIAGHYEGFDERVRQVVDLELSIGDFVLTGGELPAAVIVDAVARLLSGVLGNPDSAIEESFSDDSALEYPQYTRPDSYQPTSVDLGELVVPEILKSGNHAAIAAWRNKQSKQRSEKTNKRANFSGN